MPPLNSQVPYCGRSGNQEIHVCVQSSKAYPIISVSDHHLSPQSLASQRCSAASGVEMKIRTLAEWWWLYKQLTRTRMLKFSASHVSRSVQKCTTNQAWIFSLHPAFFHVKFLFCHACTFQNHDRRNAKKFYTKRKREATEEGQNAEPENNGDGGNRPKVKAKPTPKSSAAKASKQK